VLLLRFSCRIPLDLGMRPILNAFAGLIICSKLSWGWRDKQLPDGTEIRAGYTLCRMA
jgi:hypothetical protein